MKARHTTRREVLGTVATAAAVAAIGGPACSGSKDGPRPSGEAQSGAQPAPAPSFTAEVPMSGPLRPLGKTGVLVEAVSLGGEGVLRSTGRDREAVPMILEALRLGVRYCDTAPAYSGSQDYYGAAFREAGKGARDRVFLASKTHARDRDGALRLLDDSLRRIGTDRLDLWQLHDLRATEDLDAIFGKGGAIEAVEKAKSEGRVRFVGITGHHDPAILVEAMRRYPVDTVLCAMNPADPRRLPFLSTVVPEAKKRGVGVIGMKIMGHGRLLEDRIATVHELIRYSATFADTCIVGCSSINEVRQNLHAARTLTAPMKDDERSALEARIAPKAERYDYYKA
jgi:aryl-alcohol dehydrogenase-like predicted oxidoreductase